uniref:Uncharacterized protein n=1 Tax=viral metagenome TaxID=1070528 RepID=A0A6C0J5I4_9ZZZZ
MGKWSVLKGKLSFNECYSPPLGWRISGNLFDKWLYNNMSNKHIYFEYYHLI